MPLFSRRSRVMLVVVFVLTLAQPAFAALWYESYDAAQEAMAVGDWTGAVQHLQAALEQKGDSGAQVRTYGMNFVSYFPYLKLGIAHFELGNMDAALQSFEAEERLSAIQDSSSDLAELQDYRRRAQEAKAGQEAQSAQGIVDDNLAEARRLESAGDFSAARAALEQAQAVAADDPQVVAAMTRLLGKIAAEEQARLAQQRVVDLIAEGRTLLTAQQFGEAASKFNQALQIDPAATEATTLLSDAQDKLSEQLRSQRDAQQQREFISESLGRAGQAEQAGDLESAMGELQSVLALDSGNREAISMQQRLLRLQLQADQRSSETAEVGRLVTQAQSALDRGDYAAALTSANMALALDGNDSSAMSVFRTAVQERGRQLVGESGSANIPPQITFFTLPTLLYDLKRKALLPAGTTEGDYVKQNRGDAELVRVAVTTTPSLSLAGTIFDTSAAVLEAFEERAEGARWNLAGDDLPGTRAGEFYVTSFSIDHQLRAGLSRFQFVATDEAGEKSTASYAVLYTPPFWRSPWLYYSLGAVALALAGLLVALRIKRRNALLTRRFNPYVAGAPIMKEGLFFGRRRMLDQVLQTVHNNSLLLYGERRIGKTSLQHNIHRRLKALKDPELVFYPVYIDLQGTPQERFFSTMGHDVFEELGPILDGVEPHPSLEADPDKYEYREFVRDLRAVIKSLKVHAAPRQPKLTLLIDEVDELNDYDPRYNQKLRSLFMRSFAENLVSVVSGVGIKKQWESEGSPWYNFFEEIQVKPFRREDAELLIQKPIEGIFKLETGVVDKIISLTDCKPYLIQKLCISLVNRLYQDKRRTIRVSDVEAIGRPKEG